MKIDLLLRSSWILFSFNPEAKSGKKGRGHKMKPGLVLAIEPMINLGKKEITQLDDGWTILTKDNLPSAHFEHDVAISREGSPEVLSSFEEIEKVLNNKVKK